MHIRDSLKYKNNKKSKKAYRNPSQTGHKRIRMREKELDRSKRNSKHATNAVSAAKKQEFWDMNVSIVPITFANFIGYPKTTNAM
jgi:hypothetical protein